MARKIIVLVSLLVVAGVATMVLLTVQRVQQEEAMEGTQSSLSATCTSLGIDAPNNKEHTLIMVFNSSCDHCQWEIAHLEANREQLEDIALIFVSWEPEEVAQAYLAEHGFGDDFVPVQPDRLLNIFDGGYPQLYLYDGDALVKKEIGEVKIDVLLKALGKS